MNVGITKQVISQGIESLTTKQKYAFDKGVKEFIMKVCPNCEEEISYSEMAMAIENNKCGWCQNNWDKNYEDNNISIAS